MPSVSSGPPLKKSCPHCETELRVPAEKLRGAWAFLECYQCRKFSIIRPRVSVPAFGASEVTPIGKKRAQIRSVPTQAPMPPVFEKRDREPNIAISTAMEGHVQIKDSWAETLTEEPATLRDQTAVWPALLKLGAAFGILVVSWAMFRLGVLTLKKGISESFQTGQARSADLADPGPAPRAQLERKSVSIAAAAPPPSGQKEDLAPDPGMMRPAIRVTAASALLRSGPGTRFPKVGRVTADQTLPLEGIFGNWFEVRAGDRRAWIRDDLVRPMKETR